MRSRPLHMPCLLLCLLALPALLLAPAAARAQEEDDWEDDWDDDEAWVDEVQDEEPAPTPAPESEASEEETKEEVEEEATAPAEPRAPAAVGVPAAPAPAPKRFSWKTFEVDVDPPEAFYPEDEPQLEKKLIVERLLGIFLINAPWRHVSERVEFGDKEVHVTYWYSIGAEQEEVACDALRWLSMGRNQWSGGAENLFDELEDIDRLTVSFTNVEKRRKGKVPGAKDYKTYLTATISRDKVSDISPSAVEDVLVEHKCIDFARKTLDGFRFNTVYYEAEVRRGLEGKK